MKKPAVERIVRCMSRVKMLSSLRFGLRSMRPGRGGSEQSAIDANVSMMTLIHKSCRIVNGGFTPKKGPRNAIAKALMFGEPELWHALLEKVSEVVIRYLKAQIAAGAQAVQLFDSWASALGPRDFREFALPYLAEAVRIARGAGVPVIAFAPGAGWALEEMTAATGADVIGIDWQTDAADARRRLGDHPVALQGNLDPCWLYAPPATIRARTHEMLAAFGGRGHIANLGHGINPDVPVASAQAFIDAVKEWRAP